MTMSTLSRMSETTRLLPARLTTNELTLLSTWTGKRYGVPRTRPQINHSGDVERLGTWSLDFEVAFTDPQEWEIFKSYCQAMQNGEAGINTALPTFRSVSKKIRLIPGGLTDRTRWFRWDQEELDQISSLPGYNYAIDEITGCPVLSCKIEDRKSEFYLISSPVEAAGDCLLFRSRMAVGRPPSSATASLDPSVGGGVRSGSIRDIGSAGGVSDSRQTMTIVNGSGRTTHIAQRPGYQLCFVSKWRAQGVVSSENGGREWWDEWDEENMVRRITIEGDMFTDQPRPRGGPAPVETDRGPSEVMEDVFLLH